MHISKDISSLVTGLLNRDRRSLSKAITLLESRLECDEQMAHSILEKIYPLSGKSLRIGISGAPGAGKSSLIECLGLELCNRGHHVAVLAIDPSSPLSGGSILGDKTRMEQLAVHPNAYIRPSPGRGHLGGTSLTTREATLLCEAAGFDIVLIETIGVGQSEIEAAQMVDLFLLLISPTSGDELQGIKRGITELADFIIVTKADGDAHVLAEKTANEYQSAIGILKNSKCAQVQLTSVHNPQSITQLADNILNESDDRQKKSLFESKRQSQIEFWLESVLKSLVLKQAEIQISSGALKPIAKEVLQNKSFPYNKIKKLLKGT